MAVMYGTSGAWATILKQFATKNIKVGDINDIPRALDEYKIGLTQNALFNRIGRIKRTFSQHFSGVLSLKSCSSCLSCVSPVKDIKHDSATLQQMASELKSLMTS